VVDNCNSNDEKRLIAIDDPVPVKTRAPRVEGNRDVFVAALITVAAIPGLYFLLIIALGCSGKNGMVLVSLLIPLFLVALFVFTVILYPHFRSILCKNANLVLRIIVIIIGITLAVGYLFWLGDMIHRPSH